MGSADSAPRSCPRGRRSPRPLALVAALIVGSAGLVGVSPAWAVPPDNDDIATATVIDTLPFTDWLDTSEATSAPDDPDCFGSDASVWYVFTAPSETVLLLDIWATYDFAVSAYTGVAGVLEQVHCVGRESDDDEYFDRLTVHDEQTIYLMVAAKAPATTGGKLYLTIDVLREHTWPGQALIIEALPFADHVGELQPSRLWYQFTAPRDMWIRVWTGDFEYFTVFKGETPDALTPAGCQFMGDEKIGAACHLAAGGTYYIETHAYEGMSLSVYESGPYRRVPLAGDWNGNGRDTVGWYEEGIFRLSMANKSYGARIVTFPYGRIGDVPVVGDWNGDGRDTVGVRRGSRFLLRNSNSAGPARYDFRYGRASDVPLVGDWNSNGRDTVGVRRGNRFLLRNSNSAGPARYDFRYGRASDVPLVGDWNSNGRDTVGVRRGTEFLLRNRHSGGPAQVAFNYGRLRDVPVTGDWNRSGRDTVGVVRERSRWLLRNRNSGGPAHVDFYFDSPFY
jgi:hypothetical protein